MLIVSVPHAPVVAGATLHVPGDAATIQEAIDRATDGDRIELGPGTYYEAIRIEHRALTIEGREGPDRTVLDGTGFNQPVVTCIAALDDRIALRGIRVTGGSGDPAAYGPNLTIGGGMLIRGAAPLVENCRFMGNVVTSQGGGVWIGADAAPRFLKCRFTSNRAERGGGVYVRGSEATFVECRFTSDIANFAGGGIAAASGAAIDVLDTTFERCTTTFNGGGIHISESGAEIKRCRFVLCAAGLAGGAIYKGYNANVQLKDCEFRAISDSVHEGWHTDEQPPKGACCIADRCIETRESSCVDAGGRWSGAGTDCVSVLAVCPVSTPGDLDGDQRVDIRDVGILMSLWGEDSTTP